MNQGHYPVFQEKRNFELTTEEQRKGGGIRRRHDELKRTPRTVRYQSEVTIALTLQIIMPETANSGRRFPPGIDRWLTRHGAQVVRCEEISAIRTNRHPKALFRLDLSDGRRIKLRLLGSTRSARRMKQWTRALPQRQFAQVLASCRSAVLEEWIEGESVTDQLAPAMLAKCGQLLSTIHRFDPPQISERGNGRLHAFLRTSIDAADQLRRADALTPDMFRQLTDTMIQQLPSRAYWGLTHRDFCGDNLVIRDGVPCAIDNETMCRGFIGQDLSKTQCRWRLGNPEWNHFLKGYAMPDLIDSYWTHQRFWQLGVLCRSAAFRLRVACPSMLDPLASLHALLNSLSRCGRTAPRPKIGSRSSARSPQTSFVTPSLRRRDSALLDVST